MTVNPVYPTILVYIDLDNDGIPETNISSKVCSDLDGEHGIFSFKDSDRLSSIGNLTFDLRNEDGAYTDTSIVGKAIDVKVSYSTLTKNVFHGTVTESTVDSGEWGNRRVHVVAKDWFNIASGTRIRNVSRQTFVTADEAIPTLLAATPNPPLNTDLEAGFESFPTMFDSILQNTSVYSELDRITKSELSYLYLKFRDSASSETLKLEDYLSRGSTRPLTRIPKNIATPGFLKFHGNAGATGFLKFHGNSGASGKIKVSEAQDASFDRTMQDSSWSVGENVINQFSINNKPRLNDSSAVALYGLGTPIYLGTTQKLYIRGGYTDPVTGEEIQGFDIVTPVATTDYTFNSAADGSGTNLTGNLVTLFSSDVSGFSEGFFNTGRPGWITFFRVRGKGVYKYNTFEVLSVNTESQEQIVRTQVSDSINRDYSIDLNVSQTFADSVVAINRTPIKVMETATFLANRNEDSLLQFMCLEQGDKVQIVESEPSHTGKYYIQGIRFKITQGGVIFFTWYLKEATETICEPIAVRHNLTNADVSCRNAIDFGILPQLANLQKYSYSFWIKSADFASTYCTVIGRTADEGTGRRGNHVIADGGKLYFKSYKTPTDGNWNTTNVVLTGTNVWRHVVLTYDNTTDSADPKIYVNNVLITAISETLTPSGSSDDDSDIGLVLFNQLPNPAEVEEYDLIGFGAYLKDVRIYNKILSTDEIAELYNGVNDYSTVQDGLMFNGIYVPTDNRDDYVNATLTSDDWVLDSVYRATGKPYNSHTSVSTEMLYGLDL